MIGRIISILGNVVKIKLNINVYDLGGLIGKNIVFEEKDYNIIGEVLEGDYTYLDVKIIGEIKNNIFTYGSMVMPSFKDNCRFITKEELDIVFQNDSSANLISLGESVIYGGYRC